MALTNYSELKAAIADWLVRSDLDNRIPDFITLAEAAIYRKLRSSDNERVVTFPSNTVDISTKLAVPDDYLAPRMVVYNGQPLTRISEARFKTLLKSSDAARDPTMYTRIGDELLWYPPADAAAEVELWYHNRHPALGSSQTPDTDTNDVLLNSPDLYLFGSLLQAQAYLIGDERLEIWGTQYQVALDQETDLALDEDYQGSTVEALNAYEV